MTMEPLESRHPSTLLPEWESALSLSHSGDPEDLRPAVCVYGQPTAQGLHLHRPAGTDLQSASGGEREPKGEPAASGWSSESIQVPVLVIFISLRIIHGNNIVFFKTLTSSLHLQSWFT